MDDSQAVTGFYDVPMWERMQEGKLSLQACDKCGHVRYPPAPVCPECLSEHATWESVEGSGTVLSWVVFHRQYFSDFPVPYNAVAVRLDEGPIIVTRLVGAAAEGSWIGRRVTLQFSEHSGRIQHYAVISSCTEGSNSR